MGIRSFLRVVGSLKLAAVILVLLCVAMACATVYETMHGRSAALAVFYGARWFEGLLALLAINVLGSLAARFPWSLRQIGFVITHISILIILGGAWVSKHWSIDGHISIAEGRSARQFTIDKDALSVRPIGEQFAHYAALKGTGGPQVKVLADSPPLTFGDVRITVERYVPDSRLAERIVDDNPQPNCAMEVRMSGAGQALTQWVFADQQSDQAGMPIVLRTVRDAAEFDRFLIAPTTQPAAVKTIRVRANGASFEFPLEKCLAGPMAIGDTGLRIRVLRYLHHAIVQDKQLVDAPDRPVNPAIEFEIVGQAGTFKSFAFARFPDFGDMHSSQKGAPDVKVALSVSNDDHVAPMIEIIVEPLGRLAARFAADDLPPVVKEFKMATAIETPWPPYQFTVLRRFSHARREPTVEPVDPPRDDGIPAILIAIQVGDRRQTTWLRKYEPRQITLADSRYELAYGDQSLPLGFEVRLQKFRIGYYPGSTQPRTFESHVTFIDAMGVEQSRIISMNDPAQCGGYSLFQSSYQQSPTGPATSVLGISWDPGHPVVFIGYSTLIVGMLYVLVQRMRKPGCAIIPRQP